MSISAACRQALNKDLPPPPYSKYKEAPDSLNEIVEKRKADYRNISGSSPLTYTYMVGALLLSSLLVIALFRALRGRFHRCPSFTRDVELGHPHSLVCSEEVPEELNNRREPTDSAPTHDMGLGHSRTRNTYTSGIDTITGDPAKPATTTLLRRRRHRSTRSIEQDELNSPPSLTSASTKSRDDRSVDTSLASQVPPGSFLLKPGENGAFERHDPAQHPARIPCFFWCLGCDFDTADAEVWAAHSMSHLRNKIPPPSFSICPFCFEEREVEADGSRHWQAEFAHVVAHLHEGSRFSGRQVRLNFVQYLHELRVIGFEELLELRVHGRLRGGHWLARSGFV